MTNNQDHIAVKVEKLTRTFGDFMAVDHIDLEVAKGEIFGFLGPNGAGKSTTIRMLCGLLMPTSGTGTVGGYDIITQSEEIKQNIGYMSQKFSLYDDLTVEENINFFSGIYSVPELKKDGTQGMGAGNGGASGTRGARHADPAGRVQTAACPGLRHPARAVDPVPRRAHLRAWTRSRAGTSGT